MTERLSRILPSEPASSAYRRGPGLFAALTGLWLGLALIKFGNPVILETQLRAPTDFWEVVFMSWPVGWGYWLLALVTLAGLTTWVWRMAAPVWLTVLPLVWLLWQMLSGLQTVEPSLTKPTLAHFTACVVSFYLGLFALGRVQRLRGFWLGLLGGFLVVIVLGWQQHFGGLEETRRFFYQMPDWQDYPPEFIKKLSSNRVYSTLFYPNTLAGVILLLMPVLLASLGSIGPPSARIGIVAAGGVACLACLYWSGSKAGWLIVLGMGMAALLHTPIRRKVKLSVLGLVLVVGLLGFFTKYAEYFSRGATSVSARMDYWQAGWRLMMERPLLGGGPGTFMVGYRKLKAPEAEMARLAHNDYMQQGADSGILGCIAYMAFVTCSLALSYHRHRHAWSSFSVWLGVTGLAVQNFVEFGLYIPATAWTQFLLLGWLLGATQNQIDTRSTPK